LRQKSRLSDGVWTAFTETLRFVVVPLVLLDLVTKNYPMLTTPFMADIYEYVTFYGAMIVAASTLEAFNKPGSFKRLLFGLSALAFVCMWLFVVFGGGIAEFTYGPYHVRFDITTIVYIMLMGISLKGLLVIQTFASNRQLLIDREREKELEEKVERKAVERARRPARTRAAAPTFSSMSKVAFEVSSDDSVGYSPPPPPAPPPSSSTTRARRVVGARSKVCPVCGERVPSNAVECPSCGAWFSKESFRFGKDSSENR